MKTIKPSKYTNDNPPINDNRWHYDTHTDVMTRFKALGYKPPSEQTRKRNRG